jgi:predicted unusual protein kinase regulating ubiquinone biosynthesis (AarF/ABC1/UbiB family)
MEFVKNYYRLDRILDDLTPEQLWEFATTKIEGLPDNLPLHLVYTQVMLQVEGLSRWGLSHGDVHLGNLYAKAPDKPGDKWQIFLCDFGMMIDETEPERIIGLECGASLCYYWDGTVIGRAMLKQTRKPISSKNAANLVAHMAKVIDKYMVETKDDGTERVWMPRSQRGTQTTVLSELVYGAATCGLSMSPYNWLLLKNFTYVINMGMAMWTTFNATQMWSHHIKKFIKDVVLQDIESKNITNLERDLPELLKVVRERDRDEILRAVIEGRQVRPMEITWAEDWDVRSLSSPQPYQV